MTDFHVAMSPDDIPEEVLQEALVRALRGAEGQEVSPFYFTIALEVEGIDWEEIANQHLVIADGIWEREDRADGVIAYDFGSGEWFVIANDPLGRGELVAVVSKDEQDDVFRRLARGWIWRKGWADGRFPTTIITAFQGEAWLARDLTMALRGNEAGLVALLEEREVADYGPRAPMELWDHAVMVDGGAPTIDLFEWEARGERGAFAAWLDDVAVSWDDTGQPVLYDDALRLWLVCQYLALP